ncbi:MAG: CDP-2,3-bis-(O-geranylgeranyl)-sn-glycerol synthase [Candidatus Nezhaarchaeales archaeon]
MNFLDAAASALLFIAPAYVANAAPLLFLSLFRVRHPIDFGLTLPDGTRLFGDSKSWEGLLAGIATGTAVGLILGDFLRGLILSTGSMLGDLAASFAKRRLGLMPGQPLPLVDQLDFLAGALSLGALLGYTLSFHEIVLLISITPPIHLASNVVAYYLGLKDRPY